jgi:zinc transport system ATP-binding protein
MNAEDRWAVEMEHVTVSYGANVALQNVTMRVARGEFVGVVGPNGSGKTTLLRVILGLVQPQQGQVRVLGAPLGDLRHVRGKLGYVPQVSSIDMRFPVHVRDVVLMGRYGQIGLFHRPSATDRAAAQLAMQRVGIEKLADRQIGQLSGGQRQRVFVARALAVEPELLLLDEPTTGVDPATTGSFYDLLNQLHTEGMTILMVSHDIAVVSQYVDQVACLNRRLVVHGRPEEVLTEDVIEGCYGCGTIVLSHGSIPHMVVHAHETGRKAKNGSTIVRLRGK